MNISFYDGINDGKFFNISAGKYDDLDDIDDINVDDIDISTEVEEDEEDDANTCLNRFAALEKDVSKIHMNLNNLRNEFKGSCKDWNDLSDTVDHMLNSIAELKTIMNRANDRLNKRLNVISEANVVLTDKLNLVEKKLEVFKCIDILDRVTKLEEDSVSAQQSIASVVTKDIRDDVRLHSIDNKLKELEEQVKPIVLHDILERRWKGYHWVPFDYKFGAETESIEEFEKRIGLSRKCTESPFESNKNDIQDDPVNHPSHYTDGKYECIDFIEEYGMVTHVGNAIKYISRNGKKDTSKYAEDLNKAFWYLHRYNTPQSMGHINAIDYCHEKKLPIELAGVIINISHGEYKHAEELLGDYIVKITGKPPKALEDEQSK